MLSVAKRGRRSSCPGTSTAASWGRMVLCGAVPVYVDPACDDRLGIPLGMRREDVENAIQKHPNAKAVLVNNPTYYGICSDIQAIAKMAHDHGMLCLADEAHGTHFYFSDEPAHRPPWLPGRIWRRCPCTSPAAASPRAACSSAGPAMQEGHVRQIINLTQTTSGSYLLLSSLDISRRNLALRGREAFSQVVRLGRLRPRGNQRRSAGYYAFSKELVNGDSVFDFDRTKLSVNTLDVGLAGIEVYDLLRDEYDIQIEFGDLGNFLAYLSIGDRPREVERLVSALAEVRRRFGKPDAAGLMQPGVHRPPGGALPPGRLLRGKAEPALGGIRRARCAASLSCATRRAFPSWPRASGSPPKSCEYIQLRQGKGLQHDRPRGPGHPPPECVEGSVLTHGVLVFRNAHAPCQAVHPGGQAAVQREKRVPAHRCVRLPGVRPVPHLGRLHDADGKGRVYLPRDDYPRAHGGASPCGEGAGHRRGGRRRHPGAGAVPGFAAHRHGGDRPPGGGGVQKVPAQNRLPPGGPPAHHPL